MKFKKSLIFKKDPKWLLGPKFRKDPGSSWCVCVTSTLCSRKNHKLNFESLAWPCSYFNCQDKQCPDSLISLLWPDQWAIILNQSTKTEHFPQFYLSHLHRSTKSGNLVRKFLYIRKPLPSFLQIMFSFCTKGCVSLFCELFFSFWNAASFFCPLNSFLVYFCQQRQY